MKTIILVVHDDETDQTTVRVVQGGKFGQADDLTAKEQTAAHGLAKRLSGVWKVKTLHPKGPK